MSDRVEAANALSFRAVRKQFNRAVALDGVSFDVPEGSIFALVGPNGAGKTTLFSCVANYIFPTSGSIYMLGQDITRGAHRLAGRFSMLPQDAALAPHVRTVDHLVMLCRLAGLGTSQAHAESGRVLDLVGLADSAQTKAGQLSHGMLKRLAIAQAFLGSPELIILDEPTSGLDPENAAAIRDLIRNMVGDRTALISSHNLLELQDICTDCAVLDKGKVVVASSMDQLLGGHEIVRMTLNLPCDDELMTQLAALEGLREVAVDTRGQLRLILDTGHVSGRDRVVAAVLRLLDARGYVPRSMEQGMRLEERFLELVGGRSDGLGSR